MSTGTDPFDERGQPPDSINKVIVLSENGHHQIDGPHPFLLSNGNWETEIEVETDCSNPAAFYEYSARNIVKHRIGDHALAMADGQSIMWGEILSADYLEDETLLRMRMNAAGVPSPEELQSQNDAGELDVE